LELPKRFRFIELGGYVIMPNHFHGILIFHENVGATHQDLTNTLFNKASSPNRTTDNIAGSPLLVEKAGS
jgi:hypothetical protein